MPRAVLREAGDVLEPHREWADEDDGIETGALAAAPGMAHGEADSATSALVSWPALPAVWTEDRG